MNKKEQVNDDKKVDKIRRDYDSLTNRYDMLDKECKQKGNKLEVVELQARSLIKQAQDDAQECISYFKKIAVNQISPKNKGIISQTTHHIHSVHVSPTAPKSLLHRTIHSQEELPKIRSRTPN